VNVTDGSVDLDGDGLAEVSFHLRVALFQGHWRFLIGHFLVSFLR
jgi:hypothetical protein